MNWITGIFPLTRSDMAYRVTVALLLLAPLQIPTSMPANAQQQDLSIWCVNEHGGEWFGSRRVADDAPLCTGLLPGGGGQIHREVDAQRLCPGGTVRFTGAGALYECVEISAASVISGPQSMDAWCQNAASGYGDLMTATELGHFQRQDATRALHLSRNIDRDRVWLRKILI